MFDSSGAHGALQVVKRQLTAEAKHGEKTKKWRDLDAQVHHST